MCFTLYSLFLLSYALASLPFLLGAGVGEVEVVILDPAGKKNTACNIEDKGNSSYRCTYKPTQEGQHTIYVTFAGGQISKSPFTVNVGEGKSYTFDPLTVRLVPVHHHKKLCL